MQKEHASLLGLFFAHDTCPYREYLWFRIPIDESA